MTDSTWLVPNLTLHGSEHAVSSRHYLASSAAFAILETGGNAAESAADPRQPAQAVVR